MTAAFIIEHNNINLGETNEIDRNTYRGDIAGVTFDG